MSSKTIDLAKSQQKRKKLLKRIEELRSSKVVVYVSQAPLDDNVLLPMYQELCHIGRVEKLDLILNSYGGNIDTPFKLVKLIREFCKELTVIVPVAAKSAASMLVLGADQIIMGPFAELGPIDPVVRHPYSQDTWISVHALQYSYEYLNHLAEQNFYTDTYLDLFEKIDPWLLGDYSKMIKASQQYAELLLKEYMFKEKSSAAAEALVDKLVNGYFSHGYPITKNEAINLGLNILDVSQEISDIILDLFLEYDSLLSFAQ